MHKKTNAKCFLFAYSVCNSVVLFFTITARISEWLINRPGLMYLTCTQIIVNRVFNLSHAEYTKTDDLNATKSPCSLY